jgi:TetR/AcrR family transcriptional regulator, ethionamide resistance regulator
MSPRPSGASARTRQRILDALESLLEHQQLDAIGVVEILSEAGISSRTTYYRQFRSRDEAFIALVQHALDEIGAEVIATIDDEQLRCTPRLRDAVEHWMHRGRRHRGLARNMISEWPRIPELKAVYVQFVSDLTTRLAAAIDADRAAQRVVTKLSSRSAAAITLWSAERALFASMVSARGFSDSAATADALVAQHLHFVYGITAISGQQ